jgi:hypothetical protein
MNMRVKTTVRAGSCGGGHGAGRKVKTGVKAGSITHNHNETAVRAAALTDQTGVKAGKVGGIKRAIAAGLKVQTGVKAGDIIMPY